MEVHSQERALGRGADRRRLLRLALLPLGVAFGLAAEWASYDGVADFTVGLVLIVCGVVAWERVPESRVGALMTLAGYTWFLGNVAEPLLYLHRGPLVHLVLSYPTGHLPTRLTRVVVVVAYLDAAIEPLAQSDVLTLGLCAAVALAATQTYLRASGPMRKARGLGLAATLAFAAVLAFGAVVRLTDREADVIWAYELVIAGVAVALCLDLLRGRWTEAVVTGLVIDLGPPEEAGTLRAKLAGALGDPSLVVGYRLANRSAFVDDAGRAVELPRPGSGRVATPIDAGGEQVAVLVHDEGVLADQKLVESVAAAARIAVANARLQAEARERADELEASRRRIVEAGDAQRRRLEAELRLGAERRLEAVSTLLASSDNREQVRGLEAELEETRRDLREFAQGVHPAALTDGGLRPALSLLAARSTIPVEVKGDVELLPEPVEAALFFVCSEALANVAKHSGAAHVSIDVRAEAERVLVTVADDGVGGASLSDGSGLRGLRDRVEALGGRLTVASPRGEGTNVNATIPLP